MIIFTDHNRRKELDEAKLQPYDGTTVYEITEDGNQITEFLGNELKPFRVTKNNITQVGTTICSHYRTKIKESIYETEPDEFVELPEWWLQKENEQRFDVELFEFKTDRAKAWWGDKR